MRQFGKSREKKGKYSEKQNKTKVKMYPFKISKIFLPFFPPSYTSGCVSSWRKPSKCHVFVIHL